MRTALGMKPGRRDRDGQGVRAAVAGRGIPDRTKWSFIPQDATGAGAKPKYLVINADESEPGTCKDIPLLFTTPHFLVEGAIIAAYAIRARHAFVYVRGEVVPVLRRLQNAVAEAYEAGYLGTNILGSGYDLDLIVHAGAGAYICGEETRCWTRSRPARPARLRPPFPAVAGLYACPTVVNNVESIASVPPILRNGVDWFKSMGSEKSPGFTLYSLSGHVTRPGQYEAPLGHHAAARTAGLRRRRPRRARAEVLDPGRLVDPLLTAEHLDVPLDYEGMASAGSMLGTKALQIFDETTCVVRAVRRWTQFYAHESCGKCTPCREGTYWLTQIYERLETGRGTEEDIDKLLDISDTIFGKSFCALGDGAASPSCPSIKHFRDEYEAHLGVSCPFDPYASMLAAPEGVGA